MFFGILNRMIFFGLIKVFLISLISITGLFVMGTVIQLNQQSGVSLFTLIKLCPLLVPSVLPYTIPATALFATSVTYGRLSYDNESIAIKAAGVDLLMVLRPAFVFGLLTTLLTGFASYELIPETQRLVQQELIRDPEDMIYSILKKEKQFRGTTMPFVVYVRDVQDRRLIDVVVKRKLKEKDAKTGEVKYEFIARTREARLLIEGDELAIEQSDKWTIEGQASGESNDTKPIRVQLPPDLSQTKLLENFKGRPQTIDWKDLPSRWLEWQTSAAESAKIHDALTHIPPGVLLTAKEITQYAEQEGVNPGTIPAEPAERQKQIKHHDEMGKFFNRMVRNLQYEYHGRPALAVAGLLFALIGCPVGLWANRADYLSIFVICFIPAMVIYFPLLLSSGGMARDGKLPMIVGVWIPNIVFAFAFVVLSWRLIRR